MIPKEEKDENLTDANGFRGDTLSKLIRMCRTQPNYFFDTYKGNIESSQEFILKYLTIVIDDFFMSTS